jgi:hypothetical protein
MVIRINALPEEANPVASEKVAIDGATTRSTTIEKLVDAGAPLASQAEAEAGVNSTKRMTPLTTKQSIASEVGVTVASASQGAKANTAVQPADIAVFVPADGTAPVEDYPDLVRVDQVTNAAPGWPIAAGQPSASGVALSVRQSLYRFFQLFSPTNSDELWYRTGRAAAEAGMRAWYEILTSKNGIRRVASLAALKALPDSKLTAGDVVRMAWHTTIMDRGGGDYLVVAVGSNTYPVDNDGVVIASADAGFVFIRQEFLADGRVSPLWFGAKGDGTAQDVALGKWIAAYEALNTMPMSVDAMVTKAAWAYVPQGRFVFGTNYKWNPKGGMFNLSGVGAQSTVVGLTLCLYNDQSSEAGAAQFARIADIHLDGNNAHANGIVTGNPDDWAASFDGTYGGTRQFLIENVQAHNFTNAGMMFIRDNHGRVRKSNFNRNKYGMLILTAIDTEFEGVSCHFNTRDGVCVQPWAGDDDVGPFSGAGPGGMNLRGVNSRYSGRHNFYVTGGNASTVISNTDTESGVADLDFFGKSTIRIGNIWECYFDSLSAANFSTGSPALSMLSKTITSIVQDTTDSNDIKITLSSPHYFQRGLIFEGSNLIDMDGTGIAGYDSPTPRAGPAFVIKQVYSGNQFSVNIQYVSAFSGTATWKQPRAQLMIKGQEKGYAPRNINDIWLAGKNHNHVHLERCNRIYFPHTRLKNQITLGPSVTGIEFDHYAGVAPGVDTDDCTVHIFGASFDNGWVRKGLREFDIAWRNWGTGVTKTGSNFGYSIERPVTGGGARTDQAAYGAARYFHAVHWRPDSVVFGRHDIQNDVYRGIKSKANGDIEFANEAGVKATWAASTGQFTLNERLHLPETYTNSTAAALPNVVIESSGNLRRYVGDPIVEEGSNANGTWIKFASGSMICRSPVFDSIAVSTADGSGFQSAAQAWTLPQTFTAIPDVWGVSVGSVSQAWASAYASSTTAAEGRMFSFQSRTGRAMRMVAMGKYK